MDQSIRYHGRREAFFDGWHRTIQVVSFVTTATAFAVLFGDQGMAAQVLAAIAALGQAVDLFFTLEQGAKEHRTARVRFQALKGRMMSDPATPDAVRGWRRVRAEIEAEERPTKKALNSLAHNDALVAMGGDAGDLLHVDPIQALFAQYIDLWPGRIVAENRRPPWHKRQAKLVLAIRDAEKEMAIDGPSEAEG